MPCRRHPGPAPKVPACWPRLLAPSPSQAAEEVDRAAAAAGKLGLSTNRFVDEQRSDLALPPGAEWRPVRVVFRRCAGAGAGGEGGCGQRPALVGPRWRLPEHRAAFPGVPHCSCLAPSPPCSYGRECTYQQPFQADGARLCINCAKPVAGAAAAQPAEALLEGMTNLFCGWAFVWWEGALLVLRGRATIHPSGLHTSVPAHMLRILLPALPTHTLPTPAPPARSPAAASARAGLPSSPMAPPTAAPCSSWSGACACPAASTATPWSSACRWAALGGRGRWLGWVGTSMLWAPVARCSHAESSPCAGSPCPPPPCPSARPRPQAVEKGSRGWEVQRRRIIAARAPRLMVRPERAQHRALPAPAVHALQPTCCRQHGASLCITHTSTHRTPSPALRLAAPLHPPPAHPPLRLQHSVPAPLPPPQARGYKAYLDALVRRAVEGNAWQADHILPVYKVRRWGQRWGGGGGAGACWLFGSLLRPLLGPASPKHSWAKAAEAAWHSPAAGARAACHWAGRQPPDVNTRWA